MWPKGQKTYYTHQVLDSTIHTQGEEKAMDGEQQTHISSYQAKAPKKPAVSPWEKSWKPFSYFGKDPSPAINM